MSFAKMPNQAPQFDATALMASLKVGTNLAKQFVGWKRWVEATSEADGSGLRDVVNANALALNAVKGDVDGQQDQLAQLKVRVAAVEARPSVPFPGSGSPTAGTTRSGRLAGWLRRLRPAASGGS